MVNVLVVFAGPPCSGKSTLAAELARRLEIPHLSMDETRQRILPNAAHTRAGREVAYRVMHFAAELLLRARGSLILDAPYGHPEERDDLARIARGSELKLIECQVSPETAARRLRDRSPDPTRPDLTEDLVRRMVREYPYTGAGIVVDTETLSAEQILGLPYLSVSSAGITVS